MDSIGARKEREDLLRGRNKSLGGEILAGKDEIIFLRGKGFPQNNGV